MKVDLHCHTLKVKSGDAATRNVSVEVFAQKIMDADVKIVAITNHNMFDLAQYIKFRDAVRQYCQVWPGVELDILDDSKVHWHLIIVANPQNLSAFDEHISLLLKDANKDTVTFSMKEVVNCFSALDVLYIPHYHKDPGIPDADFQTLVTLVPEQYRIFRETSNLKSLGIFSNYQFKVIIGSDVQNWNTYETCDFAELRLPVESFEQFVLLAKRDAVNVETLLTRTHPVSIGVSPHPSIHFNLTLYPEMNVIFGQKGTGKSEILNSMKNSLENLGKSCKYYRGSQRDEDFKSILSTSGMKRDPLYMGVPNCGNEFEYIRTWSDFRPTPLSEYVTWQTTKQNNHNKNRMKITLATKLTTNARSIYSKKKSDKNSVTKIAELLRSININLYLSSEEAKTLNDLIATLADRTTDETIKSFIEWEATVLSNYSIEQIKSIADKNTDTKSHPSTTGFYDFAIRRLRLLKNVRTILKALSAAPKNEDAYLGVLEDKGSIYIRSSYRMLCPESRTSEFALGIRTLREVNADLNNLQNEICSASLVSVVSQFNDLCREHNIKDVAPFIGLSKLIVGEGREEGEDHLPYEPSNGEKGILLLQKSLSAPADAYLIDEPELGMGNSYIDQCIRPKLSDLAKEHKIVVVATHNANIAVRTLPYQTIFRKYDKGAYYTYTGNPFTNKLVDINNPDNVLSWKDESMHTLEGGKEAFYEREHIYEIGSHQC